MSEKVNEKALARVARIAAVKGIHLDGGEALNLAEFYLSSPKAEKSIVRAANCRKKAIEMNGSELLHLARFLF